MCFVAGVIHVPHQLMSQVPGGEGGYWGTDTEKQWLEMFAKQNAAVDIMSLHHYQDDKACWFNKSFCGALTPRHRPDRSCQQHTHARTCTHTHRHTHTDTHTHTQTHTHTHRHTDTHTERHTHTQSIIDRHQEEQGSRGCSCGLTWAAWTIWFLFGLVGVAAVAAVLIANQRHRKCWSRHDGRRAR
jgi:hypothetical protein